MVKELKEGLIVISDLTQNGYGVRVGTITSTTASTSSPHFPIAVRWDGLYHDLNYRCRYFEFPWVYLAENEKEALSILLKL
jgi:hypothetical protein